MRYRVDQLGGGGKKDTQVKKQNNMSSADHFAQVIDRVTYRASVMIVKGTSLGAEGVLAFMPAWFVYRGV